jgi:hypothetical protein
VVYKDVIEPLESVSVSLIPTDKATVEEFGSLEEVAFTLATSECCFMYIAISYITVLRYEFLKPGHAFLADGEHLLTCVYPRCLSSVPFFFRRPDQPQPGDQGSVPEEQDGGRACVLRV